MLVGIFFIKDNLYAWKLNFYCRSFENKKATKLSWLNGTNFTGKQMSHLNVVINPLQPFANSLIWKTYMKLLGILNGT